MNRILISISSNTPDREQKIHEAIEEMRALLPDIQTAPPYTSPSFSGRGPEYMTVAAIAHTDLPIDRLHTFTKAFEWQIGRSPQDSETGEIPVDIDIVGFNDTILKPRDMAHAPFAEAIAALQQA